MPIGAVVISALRTALFILAALVGPLAQPVAAASEGTIALQVCGTLKGHQAATASTAGSLTIGTRTFVVAPGIQPGNGGVQVAVDRDLCVEGSLGRFSNQFVRYLFFPLPPDSQLCGNVQHLSGGAPQQTSGPVVINADFGALVLTLGSGLSRPAEDARVCYVVEVARPSGDLTALRSQPVTTTNQREWISPCGTVKSYTQATPTAAGSITIGSATRAIAAGTSYTGDPAGDRTDRTTVGSNMCLEGTLGDTRAIIDYLTTAMPIELAGTASEYTPPAGPSAGVIVLSYRSHSELRVPPTIADAVDLGRGSYCYSVGVDVFGDAIATALISCGSGGVAVGPIATGIPSTAVAPGPVHQCGSFVSYTPPTAVRSGVLVIGSKTYAAAWMGSTGPAGSTPHTFNQVVASGVVSGSQVCLDGNVANSQTEANLLTDFTVTPVTAASASSSIIPASLPPTLNPGFAHATDSGPPLIPLVIAGLLALLAATWWLYRARRAKP